MWCSLYRHILIKTKHLNTKQIVLRTNCTAQSSDKNPLNSFSTAEYQKILTAVNSASAEELLSYDISKARAAKLHEWRTQNGNLSCLEDILLIEGFAQKTAHKLCQSLLDGKSKSSSSSNVSENRTRANTFIMPTADAEQLQKIRNCVAMRVGVASVSWSRLQLTADNDSCLLTHWQHYDMQQKKLHLNDLVQHCLSLDQMIPTADCYIFENPQMAQASNNPGNVQQQNVNIQRAQMIGILSYALGARSNKQSDAHMKAVQLLYLRRFLTARLFNHLVGTERVCTEDTIWQLIKNQTQSSRLQLHLEPQMQQTFDTATRAQREFLGQVLLLNLTFVRLVLLHDADSIAQVTRGANKIKQNVSN